MHTVIITDSHTTPLLAEHNRIFAPFLAERGGNICICTWNEAGRKIEDAVPGLYDAIRGHPEWRAIIFINPKLNESMPFNPRNPFDFECNQRKELEIKENDAPLVRLTHMLAGFPSLGVKGYEVCYTFYNAKNGRFEDCTYEGEPILQSDVNKLRDEISKHEYQIRRFENEIRRLEYEIRKHGNDVKDEDRKRLKDLKVRYERYKKEESRLKKEESKYAKRLVGEIKPRMFEISYSEEEMDKYKSLTQEYSFKENRPIELQILTTREMLGQDDRSATRETVRRAWEFHNEEESSDFWKVYPNSCRFLCYDIINPDHTLFFKELQKLCFLTLSLAVNQIPAQLLQAYWLYKADLEIDANDFGRILDEQKDNFLSIQAIIQERLQRSLELTQEKNKELVPKQDISVIFDHVDESDVLANGEKLGLTSDCPVPEKQFWHEYLQGTKQTIDNILFAPQEIVTCKVLEMHSKIYDFSGRDQVLDRFQIDRIKKNIDNLEAQVINANVYGLLNADAHNAEITEAGKIVRKHLGLRLTKRNALLISICSLFICFCGFIPYFISSAKISWPVLGASFGLVAAVLVLLAAGGLFALWFLRRRLLNRIKDYNKTVRAIFDRVNKSAHVFSDYFSSVCTYMYAHSLLSGVMLKHNKRQTEQRMLKAHLAYIKSEIEKSEKLCSLYEVSVENSLITSTFMNIDEKMLLELPSVSQLYELTPYKTKGTLKIVDTGKTINAPYSFIAGLSLKREEIYNKGRT